MEKKKVKATPTQITTGLIVMLLAGPVIALLTGIFVRAIHWCFMFGFNLW